MSGLPDGQDGFGLSPSQRSPSTVWLLVRAVSGRGTAITLTFDDADGVTAKGTNIVYRGVDVGEVTDVRVATDGRHVEIAASIDDQATRYLTAGTRFYLEGATPSLADLASLKSILTGPTIVLVPGTGVASRHFRGVVGTPPDTLSTAVPYVVELNGPVGGLKVGAPVTLLGFTVGRVTQVLLTYDATTGQISTPVTLAIDPSRFHIRGLAPPTDGNWGPAMNLTMSQLVDQGLRARLTQTPPLIGSVDVALDMVRGAPHAALAVSGSNWEIPAASDDGWSSLMARVGQVPIGEIGENVRAITARLRGLVSSPQLSAAIGHLDATLASLDATVHQAAPEVAPAIQRLGQTADALDVTVSSARRVLGANALAPNGNLQQTLRELGEAARSIRILANYLDQHPEALIKGRPK